MKKVARISREIGEEWTFFLTSTMSEEGMAARGGMIAGCPVISKQTDMKKLARQIERTLQATH